jgi:hypothetical protein
MGEADSSGLLLCAGCCFFSNRHDYRYHALLRSFRPLPVAQSPGDREGWALSQLALSIYRGIHT